MENDLSGYEARIAFWNCSTKKTRTSHRGNIFRNRFQQYMQCPRYPNEQSLPDGESHRPWDVKGVEKLAIRLGCVACDCAGEPIRQYSAIPRREESGEPIRQYSAIPRSKEPTQMALFRRMNDTE